jgi:sugar lactone lactonase YvrE
MRLLIAGVIGLVLGGLATPPRACAAEVAAPALKAGLGVPRGLASDNRGNVYLTSETLGLVFRLEPGGTLTVVAGIGPHDFVPFGPPDETEHSIEASRLRLSRPLGVAVDVEGARLYVSDRETGAVHRIDLSTGLATLVAGAGPSGSAGDGGEAAKTRLRGPVGLALDASGGLYIAESGAHRVRRVDPASGIIRTVAGEGVEGDVGDGAPATQARLAFPEAVAVGAKGDVYIADRGNHRIRRVRADTGRIETIAGRGIPGSSGDGGRATEALLNEPRGVAVDGSGAVLVADSGNGRIRRIDRSGRIASLPAPGMERPCGLALGRDRTLFVSDSGRRRVLEVRPGSPAVTVAGDGGAGWGGDGGPARQAYLVRPSGLVLDRHGNLFLADGGANRIRRIDAQTGVITTVAGDGRDGFEGDGGPASRACLSNPEGVALDGLGRLLVADTGNHRIRRVGSDGVIQTVAGTGGALSDGDNGPAAGAAIAGPTAIEMDREGNLYVADGMRVRRVDAYSGRIATVAGSGQFAPLPDGGPATAGSLEGVRSLAVTREALYLAESRALRVRRVDLGNGTITTVAGRGLSERGGESDRARDILLGDALAVVAAEDGSLFVGDASRGRVWRVDPGSGRASLVAGGAPGPTGASEGAATSLWLSPLSLALDAKGRLLLGVVGGAARVLRLEGDHVTAVAGGGFGF